MLQEKYDDSQGEDRFDIGFVGGYIVGRTVCSTSAAGRK